MSRDDIDRSPARRAAMTLATAVSTATLLLVTIHALSEERIANAQSAHTEAQLHELLGARAQGEPMVIDARSFAPPILKGDTATTVHRLFDDGALAAAVIEARAPNGYSGEIELLIGVEHDGTVLGIRIGKHRETPGLGDRIEARRSDWHEQFIGRRLHASDERAANWRVLPAGQDGDFDALSGATITSRAVVDAVHQTLVWFDQHREAIGDAQPDDRHE